MHGPLDAKFGMSKIVNVMKINENNTHVYKTRGITLQEVARILTSLRTAVAAKNFQLFQHLKFQPLIHTFIYVLRTIIILSSGYSHKHYSTVGLSNSHRLCSLRDKRNLHMLLGSTSYFEEFRVRRRVDNAGNVRRKTDVKWLKAV
jgi:hypothetical protein